MTSETDLPSQKERIEDLTAADNWWLIILDACRYDYFERVYSEYFQGKLSKTDNGGIGFTATWFAEMFPDEYDALCINPQPVHTFQGGPDYDERMHFGLVPSMREYEWDDATATVRPEAVLNVAQEYTSDELPGRLAQLGYVEDADKTQAVIQRGVIRFLQPHPPFKQLVELTNARANRDRQVKTAITAGDVTKAEVQDAYLDNLRWVLEVAHDWINGLDGTVVVTADHGEMLGENGMWFHSGELAQYDEMRHVPWLVVE